MALSGPGTVTRRHHAHSDWKETMVSVARRIDPDDPVHQAPKTITFYLAEAVDVIDRKFCPGYAAQHPELVGAFIQAAAMDHVARRIADALEALA